MLLGAVRPNRHFPLTSSVARTVHLKAPSHRKHIALPLINTQQRRDVAICDKYFSACFILWRPPFERALIETRHSQRALSHEKCTSHLKPMASHKETFGPRRQAMTCPVVTGTRARFFGRKRMPSLARTSVWKNGWSAWIVKHELLLNLTPAEHSSNVIRA